jgi:hypothetical protein
MMALMVASSGEGIRAVSSSLASLALGAGIALSFSGTHHRVVTYVILYGVGVVFGLIAGAAQVLLVRRSKLKSRAGELSRKIMRLYGRYYVGNHSDLLSSATPRIDRSPEMMREFDEDYAAASVAMFDELTARDIPVGDRHLFLHPTNPLGVREVGLMIGAGAERL